MDAANVFPQEVLADEEPKYLRRQKPLEIKRRKFGERLEVLSARVRVGYCRPGRLRVGLTSCALPSRFVPRMALIHPEQIELTGNHYVDAARACCEIFAPDRGQ